MTIPYQIDLSLTMFRPARLRGCPRSRRGMGVAMVRENRQMGCYLRTDGDGIAGDMTRLFERVTQAPPARRVGKESFAKARRSKFSRGSKS
jgi:hypothetical protein